MFFLHEARYRGWVSIFTYNFNNSIFSWSLTTILFHMKNIFDDQKNIITGVKKFRRLKDFTKNCQILEFCVLRRVYAASNFTVLCIFAIAAKTKN